MVSEMFELLIGGRSLFEEKTSKLKPSSLFVDIASFAQLFKSDRKRSILKLFGFGLPRP
jgi:hypothetical protein